MADTTIPENAFATIVDALDQPNLSIAERFPASHPNAHRYTHIREWWTNFGEDGNVALPRLVSEGRGRIVATHFGTYDYTAACSITAAHQHMRHPSCDFAKRVMQARWRYGHLVVRRRDQHHARRTTPRPARCAAHSGGGRRQPPLRAPCVAQCTQTMSGSI